MPVLYGVFLYMGVSSLRGIQVWTFIACSMSAPCYFLLIEAEKKTKQNLIVSGLGKASSKASNENILYNEEIGGGTRGLWG